MWGPAMKIMQKPRNPLRIQKRKGVRVKKKAETKWVGKFSECYTDNLACCCCYCCCFFFGGEEGVINVACYTSTVWKLKKILRYAARICTNTFKKILSQMPDVGNNVIEQCHSRDTLDWRALMFSRFFFFHARESFFAASVQVYIDV